MIRKNIDEILFIGFLLLSIPIFILGQKILINLILCGLIASQLICIYYHYSGRLLINRQSNFIIAFILTIASIFTFDSIFLQLIPILCLLSAYAVKELSLKTVKIFERIKTVQKQKPIQKPIKETKSPISDKSKPKDSVPKEKVVTTTPDTTPEKIKKIEYNVYNLPNNQNKFVPPFIASGGTVMPEGTTPTEAYQYQNDIR